MAQRTALYVITEALREIGVVGDGQPLTASQSQQGLDRLNDLLHSLNLDGTEYAHKDIALADNLNLEQDETLACIYWLANHLSPRFAIQPPAFVISEGEKGRRLLQARYAILEEVPVEGGLLRMAATRRFS